MTTKTIATDEMSRRGLPRVGVFHLGLQHAWQTALACQEGGSLAWFATTVFHDLARWPYRIERYLPPGLARKVGVEFRRRSSKLIDPAFLRLFGFYEWAEVIARRSFGGTDRRRFLESSHRYFFKNVIRLIEREPVDVLWGFNGFSRDVFRWAKQRGIICVLDQTIGNLRAYNDIILRERQAYPEFFIGMPSTYTEDFIDYQEEEQDLADVIVAGSEFVRSTLLNRGVALNKVRILPYGFERTEFNVPRRRILNGRPPEFLFLGQVHPRKGIHHLLEAFRGIDRSVAKLKVVGAIHIPQDIVARYRGHVEFISHVPRSAVPDLMAQSDCLVFPSLFEGSALVLYEAIGSGMGRIYSEMSGHAPPQGDGVELLQVTAATIRGAVIASCQSEDELEAWSEAAMRQRPKFVWSRYRCDVRALVGRLGI